MNRRPVWIQNIGELATLKASQPGPKKGAEMSNLGLIENGSLWIEKGRIEAVGTTVQLKQAYAARIEEADVIDAGGGLVTPGLVDPHTHFVYGGSREEEFEKRLQGFTYMEIMNAGGGIHSTAEKTAAASFNGLYNEARVRLDLFLRHGVTTIEGKSGYGPNLETELKQLRVMQALNEKHPIDIISTFMGAHAVPKSYAGQEERYVETVINEMIPAVMEEGLAEFIDVFCEKDVFSIEQSRRILMAGKAAGLLPKIHADEIVATGGAELAAEIGAVSAEHLLKTGPAGIKAMAEAGVIACLLPATALFLGEEPADARRMIDLGVAVAISTDCNPGSSPTVSMPLVMNLACLMMKMTPAETLTAATYNAACAISREDSIGSLEEGKQADFVLWNVRSYRELQYRFGVNHVHSVWKRGELLVNGFNQ
ncbi:imidazolonepropionase [Pradoshia sp.]